MALNKHSDDAMDICMDSPMTIDSFLPTNSNPTFQNHSSTENSLHDAIQINNLNIVIKLIKENTSLETTNSDGDTPLHLAFNLKLQHMVELIVPHVKNCYFRNRFRLSNLHIACTSDHVDIVKHIIEKYNVDVNDRVDINSPTYGGFTCLHFAAQWCKPQIIKLLIDKGADINLQNAEGSMSLHLAFRKRLTCIHAFVSHPDMKEVNYADKNGLSYLHILSADGNISLIENLLYFHREKVDVNAQVDGEDLLFGGYTALHFAAAYGQLEVAILLIKYEADFTIQDSKGYTPLHLAYYKNYDDLVEIFLMNHAPKYHVNPKNQENITHFHIACIGDATGMIQDFIDAGSADINARIIDEAESWSGCTALHIAVEYENKLAVEAILQANADPNIAESNGMTPLHLACQLSDYKADQVFARIHRLKTIEGGEHYYLGVIELLRDSFADQLEIVLLLIKFNAHVNTKDKTGKTPLLHVFNGQNSLSLGNMLSDRDSKRNYIVTELINFGADINLTDNEGVSLLHTLVESLKFDRNIFGLVKFAIDNKSNVNAQTETGETPLSLALQCGNHESEVISLLLKNGANANTIIDENLSTPFFKYIEKFLDSKDNQQIFEEFIKCGADMNHCLKDGKNGLHIIFSWTLEQKYKRNDEVKNIYLPGSADIEKKFQNIICISSLKKLFKFEWNLDSQDSNGCTPLHYAAIRHDAAGVEFLVNQGANIDIVDKNGKTPIEYCAGVLCTALRFFVHQALKLKSLGFSVSKNTLDAAKAIKESNCGVTDLAYLESDENLKKESKELNALKKVKIDDVATLHSMLSETPQGLSKLVKNPVFFNIISTETFETQFPIFVSVVRFQYRKGFGMIHSKSK